MAIIKFIAEYTDGSYNYLALETGATMSFCATCSESECTAVPDCTLYDVEGESESMPFCKRHISELDQNLELSWTKVEDETPESIVMHWLKENPALFIEKVPAYGPEQSCNF